MTHALVPVLLALAAPVLAGDLALRQRVTGAGATPREQMHWLTARRAITDDAQNRVVVDLDARTITIVDKRQRTYAVSGLEELRREMDRLQRQMEEQLARLPPEARKMMAERGLGGGRQPATVRATGERERIAGYDCAEHAIEGSGVRGSVWTTEALTPPFDRAAWKELMTAVAPRGGPGSAFAEAVTSVPGVPLRTVMTVPSGQSPVSVTTETLEVRREAPPPEVLAVPDGFTKAARPAAGGR
jgi:hypothetical protein